MEPTLQDVLDGIPHLASRVSSQSVTSMSSHEFPINDKRYEFRLGIYWSPGSLDDFQEMVHKYHIGDQLPVKCEEEYATVLFYKEPEKIRQEGIYFRISVRDVGKIETLGEVLGLSQT